MKKILLICCIICILLSFSVSAIWVTQKTHNETTFSTHSPYGGGDCVDSGNMLDGSYTTFAYTVGGAGHRCGYVIKDYKPANAIGAKIQVRWQQDLVYRNITLSPRLFNYDSTFIYFIIQNYMSTPNGRLLLTMYNTTTSDFGTLLAEADFPIHSAALAYNTTVNADYNSAITNQIQDVRVYWLTPNIPPSVPSTSTLNTADQLKENLIATGSGSTDSDVFPNATISYRYMFRCDNQKTGAILRNRGLNNSWQINDTCGAGHTIYALVYAWDGGNFSNSQNLSRYVNLTWTNAVFNGYNRFNGSTIIKINATITNSSGTFKKGNTTGSLRFKYACDSATFRVWSPDYMNNNSYSVSNCDFTSPKNNSYWQSQVTLNFRSLSDNSLFTSGTLRVQQKPLKNISTRTPATAIYYLNAKTYNLSASSPFANKSMNITKALSLGYAYTVNLNSTPRMGIKLFREYTGAVFNMSENATTNYTITMNVYCEEKSYRQVLKSPSFVFTNINCNFNRYLIRLETSSGQFYFRTGLINPSITNLSIYMLEPNRDTTLEYIYTLNDLTSEWLKGYINVYTYVNESRKNVIQSNWSTSNTATLYLAKFQEYHLCPVDIYGNEKCIGSIIPTTTADETLNLPGIDLGYKQNYQKILWMIQPNKTSGKAYLKVTDFSGYGFNSVNWTIYRDNITSGIVSFNQVNTNVFNTSMTATGLTNSKNYYVKLTIKSKYPYYGTKTFIQPLWMMDRTTFEGFTEYDEDIKLWFGAGLPLIVFMVATTSSALILSAIAIALMALFNGIGWYDPINYIVPLGGLQIDTMTVLISVFCMLLGFYAYKRMKV
jgi:hypothetical protein